MLAGVRQAVRGGSSRNEAICTMEQRRRAELFMFDLAGQVTPVKPNLSGCFQMHQCRETEGGK